MYIEHAQSSPHCGIVQNLEVAEALHILPSLALRVHRDKYMLRLCDACTSYSAETLRVQISEPVSRHTRSIYVTMFDLISRSS